MLHHHGVVVAYTVISHDAPVPFPARPFTLQHLWRHKRNSSAGLDAPAILVMRSRIPHVKLINATMMSFDVHVISVLALKQWRHTVDLHLEKPLPSTREEPRSSTTKASWNPVSFKETISSVWRWAETGWTHLYEASKIMAVDRYKIRNFNAKKKAILKNSPNVCGWICLPC